jgi:hypothetical protein
VRIVRIVGENCEDRRSIEVRIAGCRLRIEDCEYRKVRIAD